MLFVLSLLFALACSNAATYHAPCADGYDDPIHGLLVHTPAFSMRDVTLDTCIDACTRDTTCQGVTYRFKPTDGDAGPDAHSCAGYQTSTWDTDAPPASVISAYHYQKNPTSIACASRTKPTFMGKGPLPCLDDYYPGDWAYFSLTPLQVFNTITLHGCANKCRVRPTCRSFVYGRRSECYLDSWNGTGAIKGSFYTPSLYWAYYEINPVPVPCDTRCGPYRSCLCKNGGIISYSGDCPVCKCHRETNIPYDFSGDTTDASGDSIASGGETVPNNETTDVGNNDTTGDPVAEPDAPLKSQSTTPENHAHYGYIVAIIVLCVCLIVCAIIVIWTRQGHRANPETSLSVRSTTIHTNPIYEPLSAFDV